MTTDSSPDVFPVIMCGGSGTRLWPTSRPDSPKQFARLLPNGSTFQEAVRRLGGVGRPPLVVAGGRHEAAIRAQLGAVGSGGQLLIEPEARDSAPRMAAAAAWILAQDPEGVAVIVAADHHVPDEAAFRAAVDQARGGGARGLDRHPRVRPTHPASAYGYIRPDVSAVAAAAPEVLKVGLRRGSRTRRRRPATCRPATSGTAAISSSKPGAAGGVGPLRPRGRRGRARRRRGWPAGQRAGRACAGAALKAAPQDFHRFRGLLGSARRAPPCSRLVHVRMERSRRLEDAVLASWQRVTPWEMRGASWRTILEDAGEGCLRARAGRHGRRGGRRSARDPRHRRRNRHAGAGLCSLVVSPGGREQVVALLPPGAPAAGAEEEPSATAQGIGADHRRGLRHGRGGGVADGGGRLAAGAALATSTPGALAETADGLGAPAEQLAGDILQSRLRPDAGGGGDRRAAASGMPSSTAGLSPTMGTPERILEVNLAATLQAGGSGAAAAGGWRRGGPLRLDGRPHARDRARRGDLGHLHGAEGGATA